MPLPTLSLYLFHVEHCICPNSAYSVSKVPLIAAARLDIVLDYSLEGAIECG